MFLGRAAHHTAAPAATGHFSQKANGLGSCILTRKAVSFYGPELVAVVWAGQTPPAPSDSAAIPAPVLFPEPPWWFPSSTHLFASAEETLQIGYCIIYFPLCSILGPINPEFKQTLYGHCPAHRIWAPLLQRNQDRLSCSATFPFVYLHFCAIKTS